MITVVEDSDVPEALPRTDNYALYRCGDVFFSATAQGSAVTIHVAAEGRKAKLQLRKAVDEFCDYIFDTFGWCRMILGVIGPKSIVNLATNCGFKVMDEREGIIDGTLTHITLVVRPRP